MNLTNCISCDSSQDISTKYTAAFRKVSWKDVLDLSNLLSLIVDIVIWPIPLCSNCSKVAYGKKLKRDIRKYLIGILAGIGLSALLYGFHIISVGDDHPVLAFICIVASIIFAFLGIIVFPVVLLLTKLKLQKFVKTNAIPKNDEELAFIGIAEEILTTNSNPKYKEYIKPKQFDLNNTPLDENLKQEIKKWKNNSSKYEQNEVKEVYQHACSSQDDMINYLKNMGELDMLLSLDEWMKEKKLMEYSRKIM